MMLINRCFELPVRQILQAQIQCQSQITTRFRYTINLQLFDYIAVQVFHYLMRTWLSLQVSVIGQLKTFLTASINIHNSQRMRGYFCGRIKAPEVIFTIHARNTARQNRAGQTWFYLTAQIYERLAGCSRPLGATHKIAGIHIEIRCNHRQLLNIHLLRIQPQIHHRRTDRQRLAKAIGNHTAHRRLYFRPHRALFTLFKQKRLLNRVQHNQAHQHHQSQCGEHTQHQRKAPAGNSLRLILSGLSAHLRSTCTCLGSVILSCLRASKSRRP